MTTPDLSGAIHKPCKKRGVLVFHGLPDEVQRREDMTAESDSSQRNWRPSMIRVRPATSTERLLLSHLGYSLPASLQTNVRWLSDGVRRRFWPQLPQTLEGLDPL
jgi:hypothetical protein